MAHVRKSHRLKNKMRVFEQSDLKTNRWQKKASKSLAQKRKTDNVLVVIYGTHRSFFVSFPSRFKLVFFLIHFLCLSLSLHCRIANKHCSRKTSAACSKNVCIWFMSNVKTRIENVLIFIYRKTIFHKKCPTF